MAIRITAVRAIRVSGSWDYREPLGEGGSLSPGRVYDGFAGMSAEPAAAAPPRAAKPRRWPIPDLDAGPPYPVQAVFLQVDSSEGAIGTYGPVAAEEASHVVRRLAPQVMGEDPRAVHYLWDRLYRSNINARAGEAMMALSKLDLALWDLKGRLAGEPVWRLLGGPTRARVPAYASLLGFDQELQAAAAGTRRVVEAGYTAIKWFFRNGPADGDAGFRENVDLVRAVREAAGPDVRIAFDAWNGWSVEYAWRMIEATAAYRPWWFEEPVMPDRLDEYAEIRSRARSSGGAVLIAGGEHEYTRYGAKRLLEAGAVDVLQPDPTWCGGLTEAKKICALASTWPVQVIPHHGGYASLALIASESPALCPVQEWLFQAGRRDNVFQKHPIEPVDGGFELPDVPGLGIEIDESKADRIETLEETA